MIWEEIYKRHYYFIANICLLCTRHYFEHITCFSSFNSNNPWGRCFIHYTWLHNTYHDYSGLEQHDWLPHRFCGPAESSVQGLTGIVKVVAGLWSHLEAQMGKSLFPNTLRLLTEFFFSRIRADNILNKIYLCPKHKVGFLKINILM